MPALISSAANPVVKRARLLADRRHRRRQGAFVVEGIQPVWQALSAGAEIDTLLVAPELLDRSPAMALVAEQQARGTTVALLTRELFERLSEREGPSGLAAIVRGRVGGLDDLEATADSLLVALHEVGNPGNLGAIIRTADAVGAGGVVLLGDTTDPFAPAAVKASMGALFSVPVVHAAEPGDFLGWASARGLRVVATSAHAGAEHWSADWSPPLALLLGSEGRGLPDALLERADLRVRIPMLGTADSLNLAVAAGVLLYEARRPGAPPTRRAGSGRSRPPA